MSTNSRTKSAPGGAAFSHAKDFEDGAAPPGIQDTSAPKDSVEVLTAGTSAYNQGNAGFMASLNEAKEKQEEAGTTAI